MSSLGAETSDNVKAARHIRKKERELSEGEVDIENESEGDSEESDEDDPANQTVIRVMKDHDDSLSLRAQVVSDAIITLAAIITVSVCPSVCLSGGRRSVVNTTPDRRRSWLCSDSSKNC